jgi:hypothetical protein
MVRILLAALAACVGALALGSIAVRAPMRAQQGEALPPKLPFVLAALVTTGSSAVAVAGFLSGNDIVGAFGYAMMVLSIVWRRGQIVARMGRPSH